MSTMEKFTTYILSDVHLNNHGIEKSPSHSSSYKIFYNFLNDLLDEQEKTEGIHLILNGDIIDITGSWFQSVLPWSANKDKVQKALDKVVSEIIDANKEIFNLLRDFLKNENNKVIYVIGNHDGLLELYPKTQDLIRENVFSCKELTIKHKNKFDFVNEYESNLLGLYVEHGHKLDPYNFYDSKHKPPLGDVVTVLFINRLSEKAIRKLRKNGYSDEIIDKITHRLVDVEFIRPLVLLPLWLETIILENNHYSADNDKESIEQIIRSVGKEILLDRSAARYIVKTVKVPFVLYAMLVRSLILFPFILPFISYLCTRLVRRTHSNNFQIKIAQKLVKEKNYKLICFGHTHIPTFRALSPDAFYFNTASWTPVINLFKYKDYELAPEEFINPDNHFRKIERFGIVQIKKDLLNIDSKPVFSHKIVQSGIS